MKRLIALIALVLLGLPATAQAAAPNATTPCGVSPATVYDRWVIIVEENHSRTQTAGHMPYLDGLKDKCGEATNMTAVAGPPNGSGGHTASSLANYIAMSSGTIEKDGPGDFVADCNPSPSCQTSLESIFSQADSHFLNGQQTFSEGMVGNCRLTDTGNYRVRHNPQAYFINERTDCGFNNVPMGTTSSGNLLNAISSCGLRPINYVIPDLTHDMHDGTIAAADTWLSQWMPKILNGCDYTDGNTVVVVTWDEPALADPISTPIETVVIAPSTPVNTNASGAFNFYSMLRTQELELSFPFLGGAATATSWRTAFNL